MKSNKRKIQVNHYVIALHDRNSQNTQTCYVETPEKENDNAIKSRLKSTFPYQRENDTKDCLVWSQFFIFMHTTS